MSVDVDSPAKALVSDAGDRGVAEECPGTPRRGLLVLCLIEVVWIGVLIYGAVLTVGFVRGLI